MTDSPSFAFYGNAPKTVPSYLKTDADNPDFVVVGGGDGSILSSERRYPSIPKITIKTSKHGNKCMYESYQTLGVIQKVLEGRYEIVKEPKIEARYMNIFMVALNEIQLHNKIPTSAIRFSVEYDKENPIFKDVIGDGVVVCTPFGRKGYFQSITEGSLFFEGMGIGLNNPHSVSGDKPFKKVRICSPSDKITINLHRGPGILLADNSHISLDVLERDKILIQKHKHPAQFVKVLM